MSQTIRFLLIVWFINNENNRLHTGFTQQQETYQSQFPTAHSDISFEKLETLIVLHLGLNNNENSFRWIDYLIVAALLSCLTTF